MNGPPMKPPPHPEDAPHLRPQRPHAFVRPMGTGDLIINVAHIRGAHLGDKVVWVHMTSGKEFSLKYVSHDDAVIAFEKLWSDLEHLRLPLER